MEFCRVLVAVCIAACLESNRSVLLMSCCLGILSAGICRIFFMLLVLVYEELQNVLICSRYYYMYFTKFVYVCFFILHKFLENKRGNSVVVCYLLEQRVVDFVAVCLASCEAVQ